jgi:ceramide glucosyltransferase
MTATLYTLTGLLLLQGVVSLLEGLRYLAYVHRSLLAEPPPFTPKVSIIAPCKGLEPGLEENLRALLRQDYGDYEIILVIASAQDPARSVIDGVIAANQAALSNAGGTAPKIAGGESQAARLNRRKARVVIAEPNDSRSEKVNNLLWAVNAVAADSQVLVFVDSDALVAGDWLASLVAPLADEQVGAATGFRWYLPESGGFFAALLSAWNGSVATTLGDHSRNFTWGGSTAILKKTFEDLRVRDIWANALSDDYALTNVLQKNGRRIKFVPRCMTLSIADATLRSLLEFTTRQVIITRIYNARLWWTGIISQVLFNGGFFGGLIWASVNLASGRPAPVIYLLLGLIYCLGSAKGLLRLLAARLMLPQAARLITRLWWIYCLLWPLVSLLYLYNFLKSATTRRILWRGVLYEMRSPEETIVIRH